MSYNSRLGDDMISELLRATEHELSQLSTQRMRDSLRYTNWKNVPQRELLYRAGLHLPAYLLSMSREDRFFWGGTSSDPRLLDWAAADCLEENGWETTAKLFRPVDYRGSPVYPPVVYGRHLWVKDDNFDWAATYASFPSYYWQEGEYEVDLKAATAAARVTRANSKRYTKT